MTLGQLSAVFISVNGSNKKFLGWRGERHLSHLHKHGILSLDPSSQVKSWVWLKAPVTAAHGVRARDRRTAIWLLA